MSYNLVPLNGNVSVIPLKQKEVREYTQKTLADVETTKLEVLNYGRVVASPDNYDGCKAGDIILYQKLASHKTNFGDPRLVLVPTENIEAKLEEITNAN